MADPMNEHLRTWSVSGPPRRPRGLIFTLQMSGTMFPTTNTTEALQCERCARVVDVHPEAEIPDDWLQVVLPCGAVVFCPACIGEYGGSRSALKRVSDDVHRDRGGCPGCTA